MYNKWIFENYGTVKWIFFGFIPIFSLSTIFMQPITYTCSESFSESISQSANKIKFDITIKKSLDKSYSHFLFVFHIFHLKPNRNIFNIFFDILLGNMAFGFQRIHQPTFNKTGSSCWHALLKSQFIVPFRSQTALYLKANGHPGLKKIGQVSPLKFWFRMNSPALRKNVSAE